MSKVTVLGAGSWGTALSGLVARAGGEAVVWTREQEVADRMQRSRVNERYLPDFVLPAEVRVTSDLAGALQGAEVVLFAVPSGSMRQVAADAGPCMAGAIATSVAKGIGRGSLDRMSTVLEHRLPAGTPVAVLSGPNLARGIASGKPAATVVASRTMPVAAELAAALGSGSFRVYTSDDMVGVEIGGALKNVIALAAGIADGMNAGDNGKASIMCRGLAEITRLAVALGANPQTIAGLAGLGDLIATCASPLSRNLRAGRMLTEGLSAAEIGDRLGQVAEGMSTASAAVELGRRAGVELPICEQVLSVVNRERTTGEAVSQLMGREARPEFA